MCTGNRQLQNKNSPKTQSLIQHHPSHLQRQNLLLIHAYGLACHVKWLSSAPVRVPAGLLVFSSKSHSHFAVTVQKLIEQPWPSPLDTRTLDEHNQSTFLSICFTPCGHEGALRSSRITELAVVLLFLSASPFLSAHLFCLLCFLSLFSLSVMCPPLRASLQCESLWLHAS